MKKWRMAAIMVAAGMFLPELSQAQGMADDIHSLQGVLEQLYDEMIPLCSKLISVSQGIAGFGATWYIASRVWRHIANAEPIDFYPLFRPFVLGFCIMIFPSVLALINGIMKPTVSATSEMVKGSNQAIAQLLKKKEEALKSNNSWKMYVGADGRGNRDEWYKYTYGQDVSEESLLGVPGNDIRFAMDKMAYNVKNSIKEWMSVVLQVIFEASALCINTLRTFQLVVLAILGPLVFGIGVFDGFQHTLTSWIARYINVYLWLPVANIFGAIIAKVQEKMIALDIGQIQDQGQTVFSAADTGYLIFMLIGIVGYFTVPSVANFIVNAGFGGAMQQKITSIASTASHNAGSAGWNAGAAAGNRAAETGHHILNIPKYFNEGYHGKDSDGNSHMGDKLSGKS
ncbi:MAG TPA: conjugative transposon protein TraJ [Pedobacter sp.]|jgi:conjugative transposon TraJ protein